MEKSANKRIVVLETDNLLCAGMQSFLTDQEHIDLIAIDSTNLEEIYQSILSIQPSVIIVDQNNPVCGLKGLVRRLGELPGVRMLVINTSNNRVEVSERRQVLIQRISDFLALL